MLSKIVTTLSRSVIRRNLHNTAVLNGVIKTKNDEGDFLTKVMNAENVVLVNFHVESNENSRKISSAMQELLAPCRYVDLAIVDYNKNAKLAKTFEVKEAPTVLAIQNGLVVERFSGEIDTKAIKDLIKKYNK